MLQSYGKTILDAGSEIVLNKPEEVSGKNIFQNKIPVLDISAKNNTGMEQLRNVLRYMFYNKEINFNDQVYITNMRQKESLKAAANSLQKAMESIRMGMPEDFYTIDLMDAYSSLGSVIGEAVEDDLADEIFSRFCMGK